MKAEMNKRCPEDPRAAGKRFFNRWRRNKAAKVTQDARRVRCRAYATKWASLGDGTGCPDDVRLVDGGGNSGQAKREVMNAAAILAVDSWP
jgi:hypothetical protein